MIKNRAQRKKCGTNIEIKKRKIQFLCLAGFMKILSKKFKEVDGYDEIIILKNIRLESHCEHHIALITGKAYVAYLPKNRVVGISKLARVVDTYARRFQVQEKMTAQIANSIEEVLQPKGVGVVIVARHACMTTRGVHKSGVDMVTSTMTGSFRKNEATRLEFMKTIGDISID